MAKTKDKKDDQKKDCEKKRRISKNLPKRTKEKVIEARIFDPTKTVRQIAKELGISHPVVVQHLKSPIAKERLREVEEFTRRQLILMREKALQKLDQCLDAQKVSGEDLYIKFASAKLLLESVIKNLGSDVLPETIEWESIITETGVVERTERRIFKRETKNTGEPLDDTEEESHRDEALHLRDMPI